MPSVQSTFPIELDLSIDWRVIAFATILSLATTLVCGLVPAWRGSQTARRRRIQRRNCGLAGVGVRLDLWRRSCSRSCCSWLRAA